ncbi:MAG: PD-(D/E)XK nuclease family transposase [Chitinispirillales bacterium]|jgi:predicted transposase/invertase (TIGR01784 family)|nr:PD-(D/E)XK nuclease family transposase [Chitinispirillales bacterium]
MIPPKTKNTVNAVKKVTKKVTKAAKKNAKKIIKKAAERELVSFDFAVKYLLRGKSDYVVLSGFLSELMGKKIEVTGILESESNKADINDKTTRVDLKAQISNGELAVFEIQFLREFDFFGKVLSGVSHAVTEQVKIGGVYNIKKVYSINIAYFDFNVKREYLFTGKFNGFHGVHYKDELISFAQARTPKSKKLFDIHPEYYLILPRMFDEKLRNRFDEWVYILKNSAARDDFKAAGIKEAKTKLDYLRMPPEKKKEYERYMENVRSATSAILTAEGEGIQKGLRKGLREGRQEGLREGRQKGLRDGLREGMRRGKTLERTGNIKNMHEVGVPVAQIAKGFKLTEKEVGHILCLPPAKNRAPRKNAKKANLVFTAKTRE